jgi:hypothetical protein
LTDGRWDRLIDLKLSSARILRLILEVLMKTIVVIFVAGSIGLYFGSVANAAGRTSKPNPARHSLLSEVLREVETAPDAPEGILLPGA